jgi:hypothetical protein
MRDNHARLFACLARSERKEHPPLHFGKTKPTIESFGIRMLVFAKAKMK